MRAFTSALVLVGAVLAQPFEKRRNVVPSTCDPKVVQTILNVSQQRGVPEIVLLSAFETGLVESRLNNLDSGDRDSKGVFQQRPSQGYTNITNVEHATAAYLDRALKSIKKKPNQTSGQLAQDVQRSAFPQRYAQAQAQAQQIIDEAKTGQPLSCAPKKKTVAQQKPVVNKPALTEKQSSPNIGATQQAKQQKSTAQTANATGAATGPTATGSAVDAPATDSGSGTTTTDPAPDVTATTDSGVDATSITASGADAAAIDSNTDFTATDSSVDATVTQSVQDNVDTTQDGQKGSTNGVDPTQDSSQDGTDGTVDDGSLNGPIGDGSSNNSSEDFGVNSPSVSDSASSNSAEGSSLNQINTSDLTDATNNATGSEDGATGTVDDIFSQDDLDATGDSDSFSDPSTDFTSDSSTGLFGNDEFDTGGGDISFDFARRLRARALKWW